MRNIFACILTLAVLMLLAAPAPAQDANADRAYPFAAETRQTRLMMARILAEDGKFIESADIYLDLLKTRPLDREVVVPYVDLLLSHRQWDLAEHVLMAWLDRDRENRDALEGLARLYADTDRPADAALIYDRLAELRPDEVPLLMSGGYAHNEAGDWPLALDRFSRAVDLDPDNQDAAEALQNVLLEHRPSLNAGFTLVEDSDNAWTRTWDLAGSAQVNESTRMEAGATLIQANRKDLGLGNGVDRTLWREWARVRHTLARDWDLSAGLGAHDDWSFGFDQELGLTWRVHKPGQIDLLIERSKPYTGSVDGLARHMTFDRVGLGYTGYYDDQWGLSLAGYATNYCIDHGVAYATRWGVDFSASRRLLRDPDIFLTYTFNRSTRYYSYDSEPVSFAAAEQIHGLSVSVNQRPVRWFSYALSAGAMKDHYKPQLSYTAEGSVTFHLGNRFEWTFGHAYATDSGETAAGATRTWRTNISYIF